MCAMKSSMSRTIHGSRDDAAGNDHGRHRRRGAPVTTNATQILIGKQVWRPLAARKIADRCRRGDRSGVRHRCFESDTGARQTRFRNWPAPQPAGHRCSASGWPINCPAVPELDGLDRFEARKKAAEMLEANGLLAKTSRTKITSDSANAATSPIEPRLSEQWFLRYPKTEGSARGRARSFDPLLSRALGKGLRAMAGEHSGLVHQPPDLVGPSHSGLVSKKSETQQSHLCRIEPPSDAENWAQDPDTLDTWFSSWLWAFETMDEETREKFYPTSASRDRAGHYFLLGRAHDHRRARVQAGQDRTIEDNIPFHDVFFTGIIRDKQGRKMSQVVRQFA